MRLTAVLTVLFTVSVLAQPDAETKEIEIVEGPKLRWDLSLWGRSRPGTRIADALSESLKEYTGGNWTLNVHYGEALSKARENLDGISIGAFEAAMVCNFYHPRKNPGLMVLSLPFLPIDSWDNSRAIREAIYAHPQIEREFSRWGAVIYTSSFLPMYEFMGRGDAPRTLEDWRGLTVRAGGGIGQALAKLGATPTSTTATEVYTGVQQGTMDAAAFPFTYAHVSYRIHEVSQWFTGNLAPGTADCPIVFSRTAFERLPKVYKDLLEQVREGVIEEQRIAYEEVDKVNLPMLRSQLEEITYTEVELDEFRSRIGRPVIEEWIEENESKFSARDLVQTVFQAVGSSYD